MFARLLSENSSSCNPEWQAKLSTILKKDLAMLQRFFAALLFSTIFISGHSLWAQSAPAATSQDSAQPAAEKNDYSKSDAWLCRPGRARRVRC